MFQPARHSSPPLCLLGLALIVAFAPLRLHADAFPLVREKGAVTSLCSSADDYPVVRIAESALAGDIQAVTGKLPLLTTSCTTAGTNVLIAGTLGHSQTIADLAARHLLDGSAINGRWETFAIQIVDRPYPGVDHALVIVGSDARGTAYGLLELSRRIGVSPWVWWADVAPQHRDALSLDNVAMTSQPPSVQFRGIFLNDEDWGLRVWAAKTQDTDVKNIGPKTYAHVFELLLRLRANTLWPAMHPGTLAFNANPENARLAAQYSIVMGSSHAEPMLRNNVSEWDAARNGAWNYETNRDGVLHYWDERLQQNGKYDNIYTIGMRGIHDSAMPGSGTAADKAKVLDRVLTDQRALIAKRVRPDVTQVPQVFWMYKEVLELYRAGMSIPADVTLGWTDDNYGYLRQLSNAAERARPGGSGVYYHVSYWGDPHDYLWLCTTPPALIREEMTKAYDYGARKIWILNVGDLKPAEVDIDYFMQLAWDEPATTQLTQAEFLARWSAAQFPGALAGQAGALLDRYYHLNFDRKPEYMGFNLNKTAVAPAAYNPLAFGDQNLERRTQFQRLAADAEAVFTTLPASDRDAFFELVLYPIKAAALMNQKLLDKDVAALEAAQGRQSASLATDEERRAGDEIHQLTMEWNRRANGKWTGMMSDHPRDLQVFADIKPATTKSSDDSSLGIVLQGSAVPLGRTAPDAVKLASTAKWLAGAVPGEVASEELPAFARNDAGQQRFLDLFSNSPAGIVWKATPSAPWIKLNHSSGTVGPNNDKRLLITIDWAHLPASPVAGSIAIEGGAKIYVVPIKVVPPETTGFTASEGVISIGAADRGNRTGDGWKSISGLTGSGLAMGFADTPGAKVMGYPNFESTAPSIQYDFNLDQATAPQLSVFTLPTFPADNERQTRFAVAIDEATPQILDTRHASLWGTNVLRNSTESKLQLAPLSAGPHRLRYWPIDPGIYLQHIVLQVAPGPAAYPYPPRTQSLP